MNRFKQYAKLYTLVICASVGGHAVIAWTPGQMVFGQDDVRREIQHLEDELSKLAHHRDNLAHERERLVDQERPDKAEAVEQEILAVERRIHEIERRLEQIRERRGEAEMPAELRAAMNRLEHMHAAIEHLREAEMPDIAEMVIEHARGFEREIDQAMARRERQRVERRDPDRREATSEEFHDMIRELGGGFRQLREEVTQLREQIKRLRQRLDERDGDRVR